MKRSVLHKQSLAPFTPAQSLVNSRRSPARSFAAKKLGQGKNSRSRSTRAGVLHPPAGMWWIYCWIWCQNCC